MVEFELKFQIRAEQRNAVRAFVAGRNRKSSIQTELQASYFDTPERLLARSRIALRLRREGAIWVQTLKGAAADGLGREEYNLPLGEADLEESNFEVDPRRHAGVPLGDFLIKLLKKHPGDGLRCSYRSDVKRLSRRLKTRFGVVELAFDEGFLQAGERRLAVCELEIELLQGHPLAVTDVARRWALRHGLWLDSRSKAERGDMLARGIAIAPPQRNVELRLHKHDSARLALQASITACRKPILANAAQIASGDFEAGHVHQLRVVLRRLRSSLQLFADDPAAAELARPLVEPVALLFRGLGAARDQSVLTGQLGSRIESAMARAGFDFALPSLLGGTEHESPTQLLCSTSSQQLLLDMIEATLPPPYAHATAAIGEPAADLVPVRQRSLRKQLANRLTRWQRSIIREAAGFESLDEQARHELRKQIKRLRYSIDTAGALFDEKTVSSSLQSLKLAQRWLGDLNDVSTALHALKELNAEDCGSCFARGWLIAHSESLLVPAAAAMKQLAACKPRWK